MQTQDMAKDQIFKLRLEERDRRRLAALAEHYEMSAAQTLRTLMKEKAREIGVEARLLADDVMSSDVESAKTTLKKKRAKK